MKTSGGRSDDDARKQFHQTYQELIFDGNRNRMICQQVSRSVAEGRSPVVLTERNEHLDRLAHQMQSDGRHLVLLRGGMSKRELAATALRLESIPDNEPRVLLATGGFIGEGFDDPRLDTLFLTMPVSWRGTIAQYVGRLHRMHHRKREVRVYDFADLNVPILAKMFDRRCKGYEAVGYKILLPASACPRLACGKSSAGGPVVEGEVRRHRAAIGTRWCRHGIGEAVFAGGWRRDRFVWR